MANDKTIKIAHELGRNPFIRAGLMSAPAWMSPVLIYAAKKVQDKFDVGSAAEAALLDSELMLAAILAMAILVNLRNKDVELSKDPQLYTLYFFQFGPAIVIPLWLAATQIALTEGLAPEVTLPVATGMAIAFLSVAIYKMHSKLIEIRPSSGWSRSDEPKASMVIRRDDPKQKNEAHYLHFKHHSIALLLAVTLGFAMLAMLAAQDLNPDLDWGLTMGEQAAAVTGTAAGVMFAGAVAYEGRDLKKYWFSAAEVTSEGEYKGAPVFLVEQSASGSRNSRA